MTVSTLNINPDIVSGNLYVLKSLSEPENSRSKLIYCRKDGHIDLEYVGWGYYRAAASFYNKIAWIVFADSGYERDISNLSLVTRDINVLYTSDEFLSATQPTELENLAKRCSEAVLGLEAYISQYQGQEQKLRIIQQSIDDLRAANIKMANYKKQ